MARARALYDSTRLVESSVANGRKKRNRKEAPLWERSKNLKFKGGSKAIIVPLFEMPESATLMTWGSVVDKSKVTLLELITPVQLVVYKDKEGKEVIERMYSKGDPAYLKRKEGKSEEKDFTGRYWFEDMDGNFKRGFVYENGKSVETLLPINTEAKSGLRTSCQTSARTEVIDYFSQTCGPYGCGEFTYLYSVTYTYWVTDCDAKHAADYYDPSGNSGGAPWGDGWNNSNVDGFTVYEGWPLPADLIFKFNIWLAQKLNGSEMAWFNANFSSAPAAFWNSHQADELSRARYMCSEGDQWITDVDGTNQNAFKHAYWNALNYNSFGEATATSIANNHEDGQPASAALDVSMDQFNNHLGRKIAQTCGCSGQKLIEEVWKAISTGLGRRVSVGYQGDKELVLLKTNDATKFCNDYK